MKYTRKYRSEEDTMALPEEAITHRAQRLIDLLSYLQGHRAAKEHDLSTRTDLVLKNLLVFGSVLLVASVVLYLIF
jgi:hypothetical protein